jgi:phospholipase/carboxylesterase/glyoxalase family protein
MATNMSINKIGAIAGPHAGQPILVTGEPFESAKAVMVLAHGRGASAESILSLVPEIDQAGFAYVAPQAAGGSWWPNRFIEPIASNEPWFSSALAAIDDVLAQVAGSGIPVARTLLLGFSQGACLVLEFAARNAQRYGGVAGLSGGLFGPDGTPRDYPGSLDGTPAFLGCSREDRHIPEERVHETAQVFRQMGAVVTEKLYPPDKGHNIIQDEIDIVRNMMATTLAK